MRLIAIAIQQPVPELKKNKTFDGKLGACRAELDQANSRQGKERQVESSQRN